MGVMYGTVLEATKIEFVPIQLDLAPLAVKHGINLDVLKHFESETIDKNSVRFCFKVGGGWCEISVDTDGYGNNEYETQEGEWDELIEGDLGEFCIDIASILLDS